MLARWAVVTPTGEFQSQTSEPMAYATLVSERIALVGEVFSTLSQAVTIGVRHGISRIQGPLGEKLMDYSSHQVRLMPMLAFAHVFRLFHSDITHGWDMETQKMQAGQLKPAEFVAQLTEMHALMSTCKTWFTWDCTEYLETVRRCL